MILGKYTDDGYKFVSLDDVEFDTKKLVEILYHKGVLSNDDVQAMLPLDVDILKTKQELN